METVERTRYLPRRPAAGATCSGLLADAASAPRGVVEWHDRLRLDVTAGTASEQFALPGASRFERSDVARLLRTEMPGRGEFSTFLRNLVAGDGEPFTANGPEQTPLGKLLAFGFNVPAAKSHFLFGAASPAGSFTAYRGALYAAPDSNDLKRLTLEAEDSGPACRVQYRIDYNETRIADRDIVLPQSSVLDVVYRDGKELHSETYYSSCHRPAPEPPSAPAAAEPRPLPPGIRLRVRFDVPIDGETAAAGDTVVGIIRTTVKDKQNGVIVHSGDRLHGRIVAIEEYLAPERQWNLAIAFPTIERGVGEHGIDQGVEQPVSLVPLDDGDRALHTEILDMARLRPPGGGYFVFHDENVLLDRTFETEWETR